MTIQELNLIYIKNKFKNMLYNNILEIFSYLNNDEFYYIMNNSLLEKYKNIPNKYFLNINHVLSLSHEDREPYIKELELEIENLVKYSFDTFALAEFSYKVQDLYNSRYNLFYDVFNLVSVQNLDDLDDLNELNFILDELEIILGNKFGQFIFSIINLENNNINYNNYISNSLKLKYSKLINNNDYENKKIYNIINNDINKLKFKFAPFEYIQDITNDEFKSELMQMLGNYSDYINGEECTKILGDLDVVDYTNKFGDINVVHNCYLDILALYKYCNNIDILLEDNFMLKDLYFVICDVLENDTFEFMKENIYALIENIEDNINDEDIDNNNAERLFVDFIELKNIYSKISKYNKNKSFFKLDDLSKLSVLLNKTTDNELEQKLFKTSSIFNSLNTNTDNNLNDKLDIGLDIQEFLELKINELLEFISTIENKDLNTFNNELNIKKLKQLFFTEIPCPLDKDDIKKHAIDYINICPIQIKEAILINFDIVLNYDSYDAEFLKIMINN